MHPYICTHSTHSHTQISHTYLQIYSYHSCTQLQIHRGGESSRWREGGCTRPCGGCDQRGCSWWCCKRRLPEEMERPRGYSNTRGGRGWGKRGLWMQGKRGEEDADDRGLPLGWWYLRACRRSSTKVEVMGKEVGDDEE